MGAVLTQAVCPLGKLFLPSSTTWGSPVHHRLELAWPSGKQRKKKSGRGLFAKGDVRGKGCIGLGNILCCIEGGICITMEV